MWSAINPFVMLLIFKIEYFAKLYALVFKLINRTSIINNGNMSIGKFK